MTQQIKGKRIDRDREQIRSRLIEAYKIDHPRAEIEVRRQNSVSLRVRIIDVDFASLDRVERDAQVWRLLEKLPEKVLSQITMLLLLTPNEVKGSFANLEFEHPIESKL